ncbi:DUF3558 family protein [Actinokineospora sp. HUAS TT18]|uniref:DUF3558 family protein n=1 Tax=Actinokineospora sp. HUAS TT18 TaxID=3447451 RepID=UPI003F5240D3
MAVLLRVVVLIVTIGCGLASVACSPDRAPEVEPSVTTATSARPTAPPNIERPLDASTYRDRMCALFTDEQARPLGFPTPGRSEAKPGRSQCFWLPLETSAHMEVTLYEGIDFLGEVYRDNRPGDPPWPKESWKPALIANQPAVVLGSEYASADNLCSIAVGLSTTQAVDISLRIKGEGACAMATGVAEAIVNRLEG